MLSLTEAREIAQERLQRVGYEGLDVDVVWNRRLRTTMGRALCRRDGSNTVELNPRLFQRATRAKCINTVVHELAHVVANRYVGGNAGHGRVWKQMMRNMGEEPERCHNEDVSGLRNRRQLRYLIHCPSGCGWRFSRTKGGLKKLRGKLISGRYAHLRCQQCRTEFLPSDLHPSPSVG